MPAHATRVASRHAARALDIEKAGVIEWKIVDRSKLLLVRQPQASPIKSPKKPKEA